MQIPTFLRKRRRTKGLPTTTFDRAKRDALQPRREEVITHRREHRAVADIGTIPKGTWLVDEAVTPRQARRGRFPDLVGTIEAAEGVFEHDWELPDGKVVRAEVRPQMAAKKLASGDWKRDDDGRPVTRRRRVELATTYRDTNPTDAKTSWGGQLVALGLDEQPPTKPGARREARGSARDRRRARKVLAGFPELSDR